MGAFAKGLTGEIHLRVFICSGEILKQGNLSALRWTEGSNDGGISVLAKQWTTIKNYWGIWKEHLMALFNLWLPSQPQLICRQIPHSFPEEKILASGHVSLITLNLEGVSKTLWGGWTLQRIWWTYPPNYQNGVEVPLTFMFDFSLWC